MTSAKSLVQNARAAALFIDAYRQFVVERSDPRNQQRSIRDYLPDDLTPLVRMLSIAASARYKMMNAQKDLDRVPFFHCIVDSIGSEFATLLAPDQTALLCAKYGMLADRARRLTDSAAVNRTKLKGTEAPKEGTALYVPNSAAGKAKEPMLRRYAISEAQLAMFRYTFDLGLRDSSGEGFELAAADFLAFAVACGGVVVQGMDKFKTTVPGWHLPAALLTPNHLRSPLSPVRESTVMTTEPYCNSGHRMNPMTHVTSVVSLTAREPPLWLS